MNKSPEEKEEEEEEEPKEEEEVEGELMEDDDDNEPHGEEGDVQQQQQGCELASVWDLLWNFLQEPLDEEDEDGAGDQVLAALPAAGGGARCG